jgi:hypothetical protein
VEKMIRTVVHPDFASMIDDILAESPIIDVYDIAGDWDEGLN